MFYLAINYANGRSFPMQFHNLEEAKQAAVSAIDGGACSCYIFNETDEEIFSTF